MLPAVPSAQSLADLSLAEASALLRSRKLSPVDLTRACLDRIARLNPRLNAFITVTEDSALTQARQADAELREGHWHGPLHGVPIALKDMIDTAGVRTTAASGLFRSRVPTADAEVVRRLSAAGAVLLGKLNMHEFAYGGSSVISHFGPVHNPWDTTRCAGGSSGGSAAAVAAGLCFAAIGSDTGGSIREPAAYCGVVGLKPTFGLVSTTGTIPLSYTLDHIGPFARTVMDAALVLQVIAGPDPRDPNSLETPVPDYASALGATRRQLRIGVLRDYFFADLDPDVGSAVEQALAVLAGLFGTPREVAPLGGDADYAALVQSCIRVLQAEGYAVHQAWLAEGSGLYQPATLQRILAGKEIATPDYIRGRRQLEQLRHSVARRLEGVDVLVTPSAPVPPFPIAELEADPLASRPMEVRMLRNTRPFNGLGMPSISVPCGFTRSGLPIGLQITAAAGDERTVLQVAHAYEQATTWHNRRPPA